MDAETGTAIPPSDPTMLTPASLIVIDYIDPPEAIAPFVTTLYHFRSATSR